MWGVDLSDQIVKFVDGIDPEYFMRITEIHSKALESEHRTAAAIAIRITYGQCLEAFFALLCSALQAPRCPLGWMLKYENRDLKALIGKLVDGESFYTADDVELTWKGISRYIHRLEHLDDQEEAAQIIDFFADFWARCAYDFTDDRYAIEYNNLKHGLRVRTGGLGVWISAPIDNTQDGHPAPKPIIDSQSEFGSQFYRRKDLENERTNFGAVQVSVAWDPKAMATRIESLAVSINNVLGFLKMKVGSKDRDAKYLWPLDFRRVLQSWESSFLIQSVEGGYPIETDMIEPVTKEQILRDLMSE